MANHVENEKGQSGKGDHCYAKMVDPIVVPSSDEEGNSRTHTNTQLETSTSRHTEESPNGTEVKTGCPTDRSYGQIDHDVDLTIHAKSLLDRSLRKSTRIKYACIVNK